MSAQWYLWDLGGLLNITEEEPSRLAAIVAAMKVRQSADSDNEPPPTLAVQPSGSLLWESADFIYTSFWDSTLRDPEVFLKKTRAHSRNCQSSVCSNHYVLVMLPGRKHPSILKASPSSVPGILLGD